MEVFIHNLPYESTDRQLKEFFAPHLKEFGILHFEPSKLRSRGCATLTILDRPAAVKFLSQYGVPANAPQGATPYRRLLFRNRYITICNSKGAPNETVLRRLESEKNERSSNGQSAVKVKKVKPLIQNTFAIVQLRCGLWDYVENHLTFCAHYSDLRSGSLILGKKELVVVLKANIGHDKDVRVYIPYQSVETITEGRLSDASITLSLNQPPRFYSVPTGVLVNGDILNQIQSLSVSNGQQRSERRPMRSRICSLDPAHSSVAGSCLVYRIAILNARDLDEIHKALSAAPGTPGIIRYNTSSMSCAISFEEEMDELRKSLQDIHQFADLPFEVKFQMQALAQNGILKPSRVVGCLRYIKDMLKDNSTPALVEAIRNLGKILPYPGPDTNGKVYATSMLVKSIRDFAKNFKIAGSTYDMVGRHAHIDLVHHAIITPAGTYLEGPYMESKNRVLRKYSSSVTNFFIRVTFSDEDGDRLRIENQVLSDEVYNDRFITQLRSTLPVAGRLFQFLGFSHSSLRASQCWFMAPLTHRGRLMHPSDIIKDIGNFTGIRSPAKCAARIGQAFTDTTSTIKVEESCLHRIPDIKREEKVVINDRGDYTTFTRVFTDGVGKISLQMLKKVWAELSKTRKEHVTVLQIRFQGAKGMLALDTTLPGEQLCLRESMIKFEGSPDSELEICGAGYKCLPMLLNRDFVKVLEDLEIKPEVFLQLQDRAIKGLEDVARSPVDAAKFLEMNFIGTSARLPALLRLLDKIGIDFQDDKFLRGTVEIAALVQLRDLKYRARIPVNNSVKLYGIVDETGYLPEDCIHVRMRGNDGKLRTLIGEVAITRSPARHPGDIRRVYAMDIPTTSPLTRLYNCVIFSQNGIRDLPSQLSGGDLDGDYFDVIYDPNLIPSKQHPPADYSRPDPVDIGRTVEIADIIDFFVTFLKTDQLGRICNTHTQVADQKDSGTFDKSCLTLAEMASTAVDFAKTGIPVDLSLYPIDYNKRNKPDFMADRPHMLIDNEMKLSTTADIDEEDRTDAVTALDPENRPIKYYRSYKTLGLLYRAIDEQDFLRTLKARRRTETNDVTSRRPLMPRVWDYVKRETMLFQWDHLVTSAREIKAVYEENIIDVMYRFSPKSGFLTELEAFTGNILGKDGGLPSKRVRDSVFDLKESFNRSVSYVISWILHGDGEVDESAEDESVLGSLIGLKGEALERSIACLAVALHEEGQYVNKKVGSVSSFQYVAAAVCLGLLDRQKTLGGFGKV